VSAELVHELKRKRTTRVRVRSGRQRIISTLGPLTAIAGLGWAVLQPDRLTILHPDGQGFWWLVSEPPLYVFLVGVLFHVLVAPGLIRDLRQEDDG
jgi:hypothetical protein